MKNRVNNKRSGVWLLQSISILLFVSYVFISPVRAQETVDVGTAGTEGQVTSVATQEGVGVPAVVVGQEEGMISERIADKSSIRGRLEKIDPEKIEKYKNLSQEQKERLKGNLKRWKDFDPAKRNKVIENLRQFKKKPPEMQERIRENWNNFKRLPAEGRERVKRNFREWKGAPPEQRQLIKEKHNRLKQMPPEERKRLMQNREKWRRMPPGTKEEYRQKARENPERLRRVQEMRGGAGLPHKEGKKIKGKGMESGRGPMSKPPRVGGKPQGDRKGLKGGGGAGKRPASPKRSR